MIRRYAVEIYYTIGTVLLTLSLLATVNSIRSEQEAPLLAAVLIFVSMVFFILSGIASDVRNGRPGRLYKRSRS